ncbi:hypothetical protein VFPBJ_09720 [Purpureocillium lilacinum]|uniref:Uncharacterized protein n=1 Tax=Purpureocillium lilacinum TaxID=33203 RepID=A0A179G9D7_PURLI|nr:hypothetical protein VFPBJ_09720 [Purpureocillium lilacinum]
MKGIIPPTHVRFPLANVAFARKVFGEKLFGFITQSPDWSLDASDCVTSWWPRAATKDDAVIWLHIGNAREFVRLLFPESRNSLLTEAMDANTTASCAILELRMRNYTDFAYYTLKGSSLSAIYKILPANICKAISSSKLRAWEEDHLLCDTTDCITVRVSRKDPQQGCVRLQIGALFSLHTLTPLYN